MVRTRRISQTFAPCYFIKLGPAWHKRVIFTDQDLLKAFGAVESRMELEDKSVDPHWQWNSFLASVVCWTWPHLGPRSQQTHRLSYTDTGATSLLFRPTELCKLQQKPRLLAASILKGFWTTIWPWAVSLDWFFCLKTDSFISTYLINYITLYVEVFEKKRKFLPLDWGSRALAPFKQILVWILSATHHPCDCRQVTSPLWASDPSSIKWDSSNNHMAIVRTYGGNTFQVLSSCILGVQAPAHATYKRRFYEPNNQDTKCFLVDYKWHTIL